MGRDESQLIRRIVEATLSKLNRTLLHVAKYPVGIESHLQELHQLISVAKKDKVRFVGIYGIGGIGKTTIGKACFNKFADEFEGSSFLADVRETSKNHPANGIYEVQGLDYPRALELFSINAFKRYEPIEEYLMVSDFILGYANGLPLALEVLGSFRCGKGKNQWQSLVHNLENKPHEKIYDILKISYDALNDEQKAIFLDIACFFVGEDKDYVTQVIGSGNLCPVIGIEVLIDMSLVTIDSNRLRMHHLIQEMGKEIVRQESPEVGKRSRLWSADDIFHVLSENTFPTLLFDSVPKHLVILNMPGGHIQHLWKLTKSIENLKVMNFSHCQFLREILDLSTVPNLESLHLDHCTSLVEIYESVGSLTKLSFPRIASEMEYLTSIDITGTPIKELPSKVELLVGVGEYEGITFSEKLILIPGNKYKLMHLELLDVSPFNNFDLDIPLAILDHEILLDLHLLREAIYNWDERYGRVELLDTVLRLSSM
nr:disease resistance protein RPV1-like [Ziziphus jujuba var. spinosa]